MIWAVVGIAAAGFGFAALATALGIRMGSLRSDTMASALERDAALRAAELSQVRIVDLERIVESRGAEIQSLYEEIETCGTDEQRSRAAVAGIRRMLPSIPEAEEPDADHD